jgi:hypothetical protein
MKVVNASRGQTAGNSSSGTVLIHLDEAATRFKYAQSMFKSALELRNSNASI